MSDLLRDIARLQLEAVAGLKDLATPEGLRRRLYDMGYRVGIDDAAVEAFALSQAILETIDELAEALVFSKPQPGDLPGLISEVVTLIDDIRSFSPDTSSLGEPFDDPNFWQDFGVLLADQMVRAMLARRAPALKLLLYAMGVIKVEDLGEGTNGRSGIVESLDLTAIGDFLADPDGILSSRFGPGSDVWTGIEAGALARHLYDLGLPLRARRVSTSEAGAITSLSVSPGQRFYEILLIEGVLFGTYERREAGLRVLPVPDQQKIGLGLFATANLQGADLPLGPDWKIVLDVSSDDILQVTLDPDGLTPEPQAATATATLVSDAPETILLAGEEGGTNLELGALELGATIRVDGADHEVELWLDLEGLTLNVVASDSFLGELLGEGFGTSVDLTVAWSSRTGVTFAGSAGFYYILPTNLRIGPITLTQVELSFSAPDGAPQFAATVDVLGSFGPFAVTVGDFGLRLSLDPASDGNGLVGPYDPSVGFKAPTEFGLSIDSESVTGGGYLEIEDGRYSGALALDVVAVGISAITVIDTELPGDAGGWAFFAALTLEFPAIPLGFGFTLSGVGGLIALNRGLDTIAIASGLKSGAVDALLFPTDPVNDAALIISMIDDYFPLLEGNTVVGPIVEIGWGAPKTLLTAQIGVVISLPEGKIGLLGSIGALLPDPAAPLLTLNMDIVGEVDLPGGTMFMVASLHDSNLLEIFELSGDMGTFLNVAEQPYFLFSVGGYHPGFEPPSLVPATLHDLARMQASVEIGSSVSVTLGCYFAVTSNTVQFGAFVSLIASVEIWPTTYTARGDLGFDILLRFSPFAIIADFEAGVGIYAGNKELMGVHLAAHLEGPKPWYASGYASFKFFGVKVKFEVEVGSTAVSEPKEIVLIRGDVLLALRQRSAWQEIAPSLGVVSHVTYVDPEPEVPPEPGGEVEERIWVRPDHQLRVSQSIAPLNRTIEIVGQGLPAPTDTFLTISAAGIGEVEVGDVEEVLDWFAPAQFESMTQTEKLSRSSFEEMPAGVSFGQSSAATTAFPNKLGRSAALDYEEALWDDAPPIVVATPAGTVLHSAQAGSAANRLRRIEPPTAKEFTFMPVAFTLVDEEDGGEATGVLGDVGLPLGGVGQGAALTALASRAPGRQARFRVVSAASALEAA